MLLKAIPYILTTLIGALLVVANNIGTDANPTLLAVAGLLTVLLVLFLISLAVQRVRQRRPRLRAAPEASDPPSRPPLRVESTSDPLRRPRSPDPGPSSGPTEVSLSELPEAQQREFRRLANERTTKADPPKKPEPPPVGQGAALPDVFDNMRREPEREAIRRDARQVRNTYGAMARINGIANTTGDVKRSMQYRIDKLNERLAIYRAKWGIPAVDVGAYVPDQPQAGPAWMRAMVREADLVVWQLDHESSGSGARPPTPRV